MTVRARSIRVWLVLAGIAVALTAAQAGTATALWLGGAACVTLAVILAACDGQLHRRRNGR